VIGDTPQKYRDEHMATPALHADSPELWNDAAGRNQAEVLAAIDGGDCQEERAGSGLAE
jgi:hypothetical protein